MSVQSYNQVADHSVSTPSGRSRLLLHRAVVTSTSLLAISAAMGWSAPALAAGTCGAPSGGVANCNLTNYPTGIEYAGADAVDDLTVNVGTFAGQTAPVTVTGGIGVSSTVGATPNTFENLYVGNNVTISSTSTGEYVGALSSANSAAVYVNSGAAITASTGIHTSAGDAYFAPSGTTYSSSVANSGINNSGAITASGYGIHGSSTAATSFGINASAYSTSGIVNSGNIASVNYGIGSSAVAQSYGAYSTATAISTIANSGNVSTSGGNYASGIGAVAKANADSYYFGYATSVASASASNAGAVTTVGTNSYGVGAKSYALAGITSLPAYGSATATSSVYNGGTVTTKGAGATGLFSEAVAEGGGIFGGYATANANAINKGTVATSGDGAAGIVATATAVAYSDVRSTADAYATAVNAGKVSTTGAGAAGVKVSTVAAGLLGVYTYSNSVATGQNVGSITTSGVGSAGLSVSATGTTNGYYADSYASAVAQNTGTISTTGDGSVGIYALGGNTASGLLSAPYANANVVNTGIITTKGAGSVGIEAISSTYAEGTFIYSAAHTSVTNTGSIQTSGTGAAGIYALAESTASSPANTGYDSNGKTYAESTVVNAGSVTTSGDGAAGVVAMSKAAAYAVYIARAVTISNATNAGIISTAGASAHGLVAQSTSVAYTPAANTYTSTASATSTVVNAGSITTTGAGSNGIVGVSVAEALGSAAGASATATTKVTNAGSVSSAQGIGILAYSSAVATSGTNAQATASTTVINAGTVSANGTGGVGVQAVSLAATGAGSVPATTLVVNAAGSITASGEAGVGVLAEGAYSTVVTYAGTSITGGTGVGAAGVSTNAAEGIVSNAGSIGSDNAGIVMTGVYANIIKNTGTITGFVTLTGTGATSQNVFYNYGTWVARGGDSDFTHGASGGSNLVDEPGGTIVVVGDQSFTNLDKFTNLRGVLTMTQAASAGLGARPAFETLTISGDYEGIAGNLDVDASTVSGMQGDTFKIDGAASGITDVHATILGTPGKTTGNGILIVQANASTGAGDFVLAGNANNGHSQVDGAFEYNLAFVPGSGTGGDWYLRSTVYPGVSQFGQIGSSTSLIADSVNPSVDDLLNQAFNGSVQAASLNDTSQQVASMDNSFVPGGNGPGVSGWGRFDEARLSVTPSGSPFANYKLRVDSAQIGLDYDWHNAMNSVIVGGYVTPFSAWSDFSSLGGHIRTSGTAYGVYGLWFSGPWEAGLRLNVDDNTAHITDTFIGTNAMTKPNEKGIQAAASYDMPMSWADFTPSAEFNYGTVSGVKFTDGVNDLVKLGSTNDVWGKLNGRFSWDVTTDRGLLVQPYFNVGLLYRGDTSTKVTIGDFASGTNVNGYNGDFAVGVNTNLAAGLSLSAQADYIAGNRVEGWTGFIGLRYTPGVVETPAPAPAAPPPPPPPPAPPPPTKTFIVFFDFNKSNLTAEAQSVVTEAVKTAQSSGMVRVLVTGHTDTVGSDSYNMGLSVRRAQTVKDEMVHEGLDGGGISIEGKGFHDPLVPTGPGVREPQNRRAVIDLGN